MKYVTKKNRRRLITSFMIVTLGAMVIIGKLGYVQLLNTGKFREAALSKGIRNITLKSQRGELLDRNGMKLAFNTTDYEVWASPSQISPKDVDEVAKELSDILSIEQENIKEKLTSQKELVKIASGLNKATSEIIMGKGFGTVWTQSVVKREYPYNNFAAYVLGHMDTDSANGIAGMEKVYDGDLSGTDGKLIVNTDASGRRLPYGKDDETPAVDGNNVVLTIDEVIQHFTEKALDNVLSTYQAKRAVAIVMDPKTGEVLSMAAKPDYNPNLPRDLSTYYTNYDPAKLTNEKQVEMLSLMWRNPTVSDTYEPGSIFKLLTASAALDENLITPNTVFTDYTGSIKVKDRVIHTWDSKPDGKITVSEALDLSNNPVFVKIGALMSESKLYEKFESFGVMSKTGIDLPAESNSIYLKKNQVGPVEAATMSYGHGISATPIQVISIVSALINDGMPVTPHLLKRVVDKDGNVVREYKQVEKARIVKSSTSSQLLEMMESVVLEGSGKLAQIPGIRIGGKTGTTVKFVDGQYTSSKVYSSFLGVAPIDDPKIVVLVVVDEPKITSLGSLVATPCAKEILEDTLRYLKIEPTEKTKSKLKMPRVTGMELSKAEAIIKAMGLSVSVQPESEKDEEKKPVKGQYPLSGAEIKVGDKAILYVE